MLTEAEIKELLGQKTETNNLDCKESHLSTGEGDHSDPTIPSNDYGLAEKKRESSINPSCSVALVDLVLR